MDRVHRPGNDEEPDRLSFVLLYLLERQPSFCSPSSGQISSLGRGGPRVFAADPSKRKGSSCMMVAPIHEPICSPSALSRLDWSSDAADYVASGDCRSG